MSKISVKVGVIGLWLVSASILYGQADTGRITGTITDTSEAGVPGARVSVENEGTALRRELTTTDSGNYTAALLPPGKYRVTVQKDGFKAAGQSSIQLNVDQVVRVDFVLQIGEVAETIKVESDVIALDTDSATIGQVVNQRLVVELPLNGRNFTQLLLLGPGAVQTGGEQSTRANSGNAISLQGARPASNSYLIDGMVNNDTAYQTPAVIPSIDAIQEFKEQTKQYSAEYGGAANIINISLKSGTNALHGTAFEFLRNDALDARNFFDGSSIAPLRQNQFGYTLGGPIYIPKLYDGRNRTFFFANYEGLRVRSSYTTFGNVPTSEELNGQFQTVITDPLTGQPFPNNQIPATRVSQFGSQVRTHFPAANTSLPQGNYIAVVGTPNDANQQNYRLDQNFGSKNSFFFRYSVTDYSSVSPGLIAEGNKNFIQNSESYQFAYTRTFTPSIINQFRFGHLEPTSTQTGVPASRSSLDALGLKNIYDYPNASYPTVSLSGIGPQVSIGGAANQPTIYDEPTIDISNSLLINKGSHTFSVGIGVRHWKQNVETANSIYGQFTFDGSISGHNVADLLLGYPQSLLVNQPAPYSDPQKPGQIAFLHYSIVAPYFQDDWKVNQRLTLNLGIRYDWSSVPYEEKNRWSWFDPTAPGGGLCIADKKLVTDGIAGTLYKLCGGRTAGASQKMVFAPRFGFAYRPFGGTGTVVRGGYGVFFDQSEQWEQTGNGAIYPYSISGNYISSPENRTQTANLYPALSSVHTVGKNDIGFYFTTPPFPQNPYMQSWSLSVQKDLSQKIKAEVSYVGSKGTHLLTRNFINQPYPYDPANPSSVLARTPYPNFQTILEGDPRGNSHYNALNVKVEHSSNDLSLIAAYTWANSMDDKSAASGLDGDAAGWAGPMNAHNHRLDYSRSSYDVNQRFIASFVYELPVGRGKRLLDSANRFADLLIGGWQVNGIVTFQQGFPFSITATDIGGLNQAYGQRADVVGNPYPSGFVKSVNGWFDRKAFAQPAMGLYGTSGRNVLRSPGINNWDLSLFKNVTITERLRYQLRFESFNTFNHTQFTQPDANVDSPTFGVISGARPGRILQLAMKLLW
jgi:hypothetical protein